MDILIHEIMKYSAVLIALGSFIGIIPNIYLSIKLRKKKIFITESIIDAVPERLKDKIRFGISANMSWAFAAYSLYLWLPYLFFRYGQHVTQIEFKSWHLATKEAFGQHFYLGLISAIGGNFVGVGAVIFISLSIYSK